MNQKRTLGFILILLAAALLYYFSSRTTERTVASISVPALAKKWEFTGSGHFVGALALADDGTLYAASDDGNFFALDSNGVLQSKTYIGPTKSAPSIGPDGAIYISNSNGKVIALNRSGVVRWSTQVYQGLTAGQNGAAIGRDELYIHSRDGLYALRLANGQIDWASRWGGDQWGSVTLLSDGTLLSPGRGRLNALDSRGELSWQYPGPSAESTQQTHGLPPPGNFFVSSGIAIGNNRALYVAIDRTHMVALGLDGSFKWELPARSTQLNRASPVIAADGTIYFGSAEGVLSAMNTDGTAKWTLPLEAPLLATPVIAQDGSLFVVAGTSLWVITPDGKILARTSADTGAESSPTISSDGTLYLATSGGKIIAFEGGHGPLMDSPWPKYQGDLANSGNPRTL